MTANRIVIAVALLWAVMVGASFVHPAMQASQPDAFHENMERLARFFVWQAFAIIPAIVALFLRTLLKDRLTDIVRWLGWIPSVASPLLILLLIAVGRLLE